MATKPTVTITFSQLASTLIERSGERPVIILGEKAASGGVLEQFDILSGEATAEAMADYAAEGAEELAASVNLAISASPAKLYISTYAASDLWKALLAEDLGNAVIAAGCEGSAASDVLAAFRNFNEKYQQTVLFVDGTSDIADLRHISASNLVNYYNDEGEKLTDSNVASMYAGAIAACGCERSLTNYVLPVASCEYAAEFGNEPDLTAEGQLGAEMKGGKARVIAGINTAEVTGDVTEDMQYIEVVNTMDMIAKDISDTFIEYYRGKYKNNYDNQLLFISAVNEYFRELMEEDALDDEYDNRASIDVYHQQQAWIASGKSEAADWDEQTIRTMSFKRTVFVQANIKVCQSMESLVMHIELQ